MWYVCGYKLTSFPLFENNREYMPLVSTHHPLKSIHRQKSDVAATDNIDQEKCPNL